jgi:hypothetical protein
MSLSTQLAHTITADTLNPIRVAFEAQCCAPRKPLWVESTRRLSRFDRPLSSHCGRCGESAPRANRRHQRQLTWPRTRTAVPWVPTALARRGAPWVRAGTGPPDRCARALVLGPHLLRRAQRGEHANVDQCGHRDAEEREAERQPARRPGRLRHVGVEEQPSDRISQVMRWPISMSSCVHCSRSARYWSHSATSGVRCVCIGAVRPAPPRAPGTAPASPASAADPP